jgi:hypothetical protein
MRLVLCIDIAYPCEVLHPTNIVIISHNSISSESSPELLEVYPSHICPSPEYDILDGRQVDRLVEHIDCDDEPSTIIRIGETTEGIIALGSRVICESDI